MTLYRVEVEEHHMRILYVEADTAIEAEDAAEELSHNFEPDDVDVYVYAHPTAPNHDDADIWVGGEAGEFITYAEYKERFNA